MTDEQVYQMLMVGVPPAQILAAGGNQVQIDAGTARILAAAQAAAQPLAPAAGHQNAAVAAGVQALVVKIESEVVSTISGLKVSVFDKYFYFFMGSVGVIIALLLFMVWPKGQQVAVSSTPAATTVAIPPIPPTVTFNIPPLEFKPIKIEVSVTGVQPGKP